MAIKGKSKTKSKPRQVARAPRREPVAVKPPVPQRRWVQVTAAFVVGVFAMIVLVWVTNGLRQDKADSQAADTAAQRRTAATAWQGEVASAMAKVGTANQGLPPTVFADMSKALDSMKKGTVPDKATDTFTQAADNAQAAIDSLDTFDLTATIKDHGFTPSQAVAFADSKDRLVAAMQLYQTAADVGKQAALATGDHQVALTAIAVRLRDSALTQFQQAWSLVREAVAAGGLVDQAPGIVPLPGGGT